MSESFTHNFPDKENLDVNERANVALAFMEEAVRVATAFSGNSLVAAWCMSVRSILYENDKEVTSYVLWESERQPHDVTMGLVNAARIIAESSFKNDSL